jgi:putative ABC transport system substrate-binding protein
MQRRAFFASIVAATALGPFASRARPENLWRIGYLTGGSAAGPSFEGFCKRMAELGYVEGSNITYEARFAEGHFERLPEFARELVALSPEALLVATTPANVAVKSATSTIPVVMLGVADPVGAGIVQSLARPGSNITGVTNISAELAGKRIEIIKEIIPAAARVAVLVNPGDPNTPLQMQRAEAAARRLDIQLQPVAEVRSAADIEKAFDAAVRSNAAAAIRMVDPLVTTLAREASAAEIKYRLPVVYPFRENVVAGGLVSYGTSLASQGAQAAEMMNKILKGAKPGDLPVEQPTRFELIINLNTAKTLGITIPPALLARADEVIE